MITLLVTFVHSCKDEGIHREFKKQCGASCVYYNDELAVLVVLVSDLKPHVKNVLIYSLCQTFIRDSITLHTRNNQAHWL